MFDMQNIKYIFISMSLFHAINIDELFPVSVSLVPFLGIIIFHYRHQGSCQAVACPKAGFCPITLDYCSNMAGHFCSQKLWGFIIE